MSPEALLRVENLAAILVVTIVAGAINSVAGGGTLITFPFLLQMGLTGKIANATSTLGLWPASLGAAWGYRQEIHRSKAELALLFVPSLVGGAIGAVLVKLTSDKTFDQLVPWLILAATVLFMVQRPISAWLERISKPVGDSKHTPMSRKVGIAMLQFVVAIYGGYFGAGMGILMLAAFGLLGIEDIHQRNGIKNLCGAAINGVAIGIFIYLGLIDWLVALVMAIGALLGGYYAAGIAKRLGQQRVRQIVIAIGLLSAGWTAYGAFGN